MSLKGKVYQKLPLFFKMNREIGLNLKNNVQKPLEFINDAPRVYIIGESDNGNVGDLAITITHYAMIKKYIAEDRQIIRILYSNFWNYYKFLKEQIRPCDLITIPGGGNIGDVYVEAENIRQTIIHDFPNNEIIVFPSTIYFSKEYENSEIYKRSLKIYNRHSNFTIYAREEFSYKFLKKIYPRVKVHLIPDMVLQYSVDKKNIKKSDKILLCLRNDSEKNLTDNNKKDILKICKELSPNVINTDTFIEDIYAPYDEQRKLILERKLKEFSTAKLIITDRLHGMILSYLTKTPCVVFSNYNYKIKGVYEWIKDEKNVIFVKDLDKGLKEISNLYHKKDYQFNENIRFDYKRLESQLLNWGEKGKYAKG